MYPFRGLPELPVRGHEKTRESTPKRATIGAAGNGSGPGTAMTDAGAAVALLGLFFLAAGSYRYRIVLQPNRAAATLYAGGVVLWGAALFGVWLAWSHSGGGACAGDVCDPAFEAIDNAVAGVGLELPDDFLGSIGDAP